MAEIKGFSGDSSLGRIVLDEKQEEAVYAIDDVRSYMDAYVNRLPIVWFSGEDDGEARQCVQMSTRVPGEHVLDFAYDPYGYKQTLECQTSRSVCPDYWLAQRVINPGFGVIVYQILPPADPQQVGQVEAPGKKKVVKRSVWKVGQSLHQASIQERRRTKGRRQSQQARNKKKPHKMGRVRDQDRVVHLDDVYEDDMESYELAMEEEIMAFMRDPEDSYWSDDLSSADRLFGRYFDY